MQSRIRLVALAAALVATGAAHATVAFDANIENDSTYTDKQGTTKSATTNGGRVEINANAQLMKNGDNFVNARASLIVPTGSGTSVSLDDAWIQLGNSSVDLKVGRYEAVDLFPLGKDVLVSPAVSSLGYKTNRLRGRTTTGQLHALAGLNASSSLRFELGVVTAADSYAYGLRPTVTYNAGPLSVRVGAESIKKDAYTSTSTGTAVIGGNTVVTQTTTTNAEANSEGYGLSLGYAFSESANVNVNYGRNDKEDGTSIGVNLVYGAAGIGYVQDKSGNTTSDTVYVAYSFPLLGIKGATVTPAISSSTGTNVDSLNALRVRLNYAF